MQMKPEHAKCLIQLSKLQHLSLRSRLIVARRVARYICNAKLSSSYADWERKKSNQGATHHKMPASLDQGNAK